MGVTDMLHDRLESLSLPISDDLIGHKFRFFCRMGPDLFIIAGTVNGLSISTKDGTRLFVSVPSLGGKKLQSLLAGEKVWVAVLEGKSPAHGTLHFQGHLEFFQGHLEFYTHNVDPWFVGPSQR
jgi:hypothetical protein